MAMRLPPLNALRAFEAAARHSSVHKAAKELHVTPAAVSHQIKSLEEHLGFDLFKREPRRLRLTPAAEACLPKLSAAFAQMAEAMSIAQQLADSARVTVSVAPALAAKWVIPRLSHFRDLHPEIDLRIAARQSMRDVTSGETEAAGNPLEDADIAIRFGAAQYPDYIIHPLFESYTLPMCSPKLLEGEHALRTPDDLRYHTLLHYESDNAMMDVGRPNWASWLKAAGVRGINTRRGTTFNHVTMALRAAEDGLGVVLGTPITAAAELASGRLVTPFPLSLPLGVSYYLIYAASAKDQPSVMAFRDWILSEARDDPWAHPRGVPGTSGENAAPIASPGLPD